MLTSPSSSMICLVGSRQAIAREGRAEQDTTSSYAAPFSDATAVHGVVRVCQNPIFLRLCSLQGNIGGSLGEGRRVPAPKEAAATRRCVSRQPEGKGYARLSSPELTPVGFCGTPKVLTSMAETSVCIAARSIIVLAHFARAFASLARWVDDLWVLVVSGSLAAAVQVGCSDDVADGAPVVESSGPGVASSRPGDGGMAVASDSGASGGAEEAGTETTTPDMGNASCEPSRLGASPPLRRLTHVQYESSLRDLLVTALGSEVEAQGVLTEIADELGRLPQEIRVQLPEDLHGSYRRLDQTVQQTHVDAWFQVGEAVGRNLTQKERLPSLLGACATGAASDADVEQCIRSFVENFGRLALRRPLTSEEVDFYVSFHEPPTGIDSAGIEPAGVAAVITGLLNAPQFLYLVERGEQALPGQADTFALSAWELAQRLSFHFWNTMPDARLRELALSGELLVDEVYEGEVERLWADGRTHDTITRFFREWLKLEALPDLHRNVLDAVFSSFAIPNLPSVDLRAAMIDEVLDLLNHYTWDVPSGLSEVFLTPYAFTKSDELAKIYGIEAWDGSSNPPALEGRPGILTRAAFLATGTANTRPIMKGVFIRTNVLCDEIPPPPPNAAAFPPELSPDLTTREVVEALTEGDTNAGCAACHQTFINPLGFATEGFDSLGRARSEQRLFDADGVTLGSKSVETRAIPQVTIGDQTEVSGAAELMQAIASSGKLEACFARHYFRFTFGRFENLAEDECVLEQMRKSLLETGSIADMLRAVALSEAFRSKTLVPSSTEDSP